MKIDIVTLEKIYTLRKQGKSIRAIGKELGINYTVVSICLNVWESIRDEYKQGQKCCMAVGKYMQILKNKDVKIQKLQKFKKIADNTFAIAFISFIAGYMLAFFYLR